MNQKYMDANGLYILYRRMKKTDLAISYEEERSAYVVGHGRLKVHGPGILDGGNTSYFFCSA